MRHLLNPLLGILTLLYPAAVYFGLQYLQPWSIAALLAGVLAIKLMLSEQSWTKPVLVCGLVFAGFAIWRNDFVSLRFYPVLVNAVMLLIFAGSLFYPPSIVERLARLQQPDLPPQGVCYTRRVTQVWCGFFIINGSIALATALWSSFAAWSLYNGLIAYLLMGLLFAGEYLIRRRTQKQDA
jgi:uncharacterized membrane protein